LAASGEAAIGTHDLGVDPAALADGKELHHIGDVFHLT
jgi:hypothetical protein